MGGKPTTLTPDMLESIYRFIVAHKILVNGLAPTIREIGDAVGLSSTSTVRDGLYRLHTAGRIVVVDEAARGIIVPELSVIPNRMLGKFVTVDDVVSLQAGWAYDYPGVAVRVVSAHNHEY